MSTYVFSPAERWGVFSVHGPFCYYNREPIDFVAMEVDHLIPESLSRDPDKLSLALGMLNLPATFDLNSYENWLPICGPCNATKSARIFEPTPLIQQQLSKARDGAERARQAALQVVTNRQLGNAIAVILRAASGVGLEQHHFEALVISLLAANPSLAARIAQAGRTADDHSIGLSRWTVPEEDPAPIAQVQLTPGLAIAFWADRAGLVKLPADRSGSRP